MVVITEKTLSYVILNLLKMELSTGKLFSCILFLSLTSTAESEIHPVVKSTADGFYIQIADEKHIIFSSVRGNSCLIVIQPSGVTGIRYKTNEEIKGTLSLSGGYATGLRISESYRIITPGLIERIVEVKSESDQRYYLDFGWKSVQEGDFYSFLKEEEISGKYSPGCAGPEFGDNISGQTFPFLGVRSGEKLYGVIGDTPGKWENRSFLIFDCENKNLSLCNGDGSEKRVISIPFNIDATSVYRTQFDGWQHIEQGETQLWKTWIFSSEVKSLYDVQLSAHLALANAKGFNRSGIEAILRNTSYLLLRRNLSRPESDYIFISGVGYGWKQWVTDGFYMSRGLDDIMFDRAAYAAVFFERVNYEDNAQYYLIWSALVKRAGGDPDMRMVKRAYNFIREHEIDGLFYPPRLTPESKGFRTYHDQLKYEDDDAPSSNQGFHCGALMAARELGFPVTEEEISRAIAGY